MTQGLVYVARPVFHRTLNPGFFSEVSSYDVAGSICETLDGGDGGCFKCGGTGHWAKECPNGGAGGWVGQGTHIDRDGGVGAGGRGRVLRSSAFQMHLRRFSSLKLYETTQRISHMVLTG
jgi:hypothetical protein